MMDIPQAAEGIDLALVEKRGPSIVINDPPAWTVAPVARVASYSFCERSAQNGSQC